MSVTMQTNIASMNAQMNLSQTQNALSTSFNRLSSGYRINSSADDAAGLAISEGMQMQIRSYTVAERNANDAISMAQTADGALGEVTDIMQRMRELGVQGANGSLTSTDRSYLQTEFGQLQAEVKRIMTSVKFNGQSLITQASASVQFQVGINNVTSDRITLTFGGLKLTALVSSSTTLSGSAVGSQKSLDTIDNALTNISTTRARFGAAMNRLQVTTSNIETMRVNVSAANSRIMDVDVADETSNMSREQVLAQSGAAVLAQANQMPQIALSLLKG